jgi:hypothetical protein
MEPPCGAAIRVVLDQDAADPDQLFCAERLGWPLGRGLLRAGWGRGLRRTRGPLRGSTCEGRSVLASQKGAQKRAEVVLFHHAQGLTPASVAFAGKRRRAGGDLTVEGRERRVSNPQRQGPAGASERVCRLVMREVSERPELDPRLPSGHLALVDEGEIGWLVPETLPRRVGDEDRVRSALRQLLQP